MPLFSIATLYVREVPGVYSTLAIYGYPATMSSGVAIGLTPKNPITLAFGLTLTLAVAAPSGSLALRPNGSPATKLSQS